MEKPMSLCGREHEGYGVKTDCTALRERLAFDEAISGEIATAVPLSLSLFVQGAKVTPISLRTQSGFDES